MAEQVSDSSSASGSSGSESEQDIDFCAIEDDNGSEDYDDDSSPMKSGVFISKSDQCGADRHRIIPPNVARPRAVKPTAVGPDLAYLWNRSDSPGPGQSASGTSASFESIHSELSDSCPLIFSVDDVVRSNQNYDHTVPSSSPSTTSANEESLNGEVHHVIVTDILNKKDLSDTCITTNVTTDVFGHGNITADESTSKDTTISSELRSDVNLSTVFPDQRQNFKFKIYGRGQSSSSEDSLSSAPDTFRINFIGQDSPECLINRLDDQIDQLTDILSDMLANDIQRSGDVKQNAGDTENIVSSIIADRENIKKTITSTQETWKQFRVYLLDLMGETDYLEVQVKDLTKRLKSREGDNLRLRCERREFQHYLEEREREWVALEKELKSELDYYNAKLFDVSESKMDWAKETRMLEALMDLQYDREQGIILDTAKQNKMNELKLLVYRQQLLIEELQEDNITLRQEINSLITKNPMLQRETKLVNTNYNNNDISSICDVLYCDRGQYLPGCSKQPELASLQVFNIGGRHPKCKSTHEDVFQPLKLNYNLPTNDYKATELNEVYYSLMANGPGAPGFTLAEEQVGQ